MMNFRIHERGGLKYFAWKCSDCPAVMASLSWEHVGELRKKHLAWHRELKEKQEQEAKKTEGAA